MVCQASCDFDESLSLLGESMSITAGLRVNVDLLLCQCRFLPIPPMHHTRQVNFFSVDDYDVDEADKKFDLKLRKCGSENGHLRRRVSIKWLFELEPDLGTVIADTNHGNARYIRDINRSI